MGLYYVNDKNKSYLMEITIVTTQCLHYIFRKKEGRKMKIGIRAHDMENAPLNELVRNIHNKGFKSTQLALSKSIYEFNVSPMAMTPGMAMHIRDVFASNQVDIAVLGCYLNISSPDKEDNRQIKEVYKTHMRFARHLGCAMVGTETGAVNKEYKFEPANHSEAGLNQFIENCKEVTEYAEKMGVIFGIEPVYSHIMSDIERTHKVLQAVNSPNLQVIFDPVNLLSVHNESKHDDIINGAFELFGKDIAVVHAKDYYVENDSIISVPAGTGHLNYDLLLRKIKENKPFIHVLLENTEPHNAIETREFVENKYNNIIL